MVLLQGAALQGNSQTEMDVTLGAFTLIGSDFQADIDGALLSGSISCHEAPEERVLEMWLAGTGLEFRQPLVKTWERSGAAPAAVGRVLSPMPGRVTKVRHVGICIYFHEMGNKTHPSTDLTGGGP